MIAIPCMDMVHTVFLRSILALNKVGDVQFGLSCSSLVYDARNTLTKKAIAGGFDRILWLDSDMDFQPDLMERLSADLDDGREFVAGLYFKRKAPVQPVVYKQVGYWKMEDESVRPIALCYEDYPRDDIFEVEGVGFGACMMTVDLAKRVVEKIGVPFAPILGFGEDLSFCLRVAQVGAKMYCDSRIKLGHVGQGTVTEETYLGVLNAGTGETRAADHVERV